MPYTIGGTQQELSDRPARNSPAFSDPTWHWLAQQDFDLNRAWASSSATRRGTLAGGPTYQRFLDMGNEKQWAVFQQKPSLTTPVLPDEQQFYRRQLGAIEWDSINPLNTIDQGADQVLQATGQDFLAPLRNVQEFLGSKSIDLMGMGSTGAPARAADYALAFPIAVFNKLTGQASNPAAPPPQDDIYYRWHADSRYWQTMKTATPTQLDELAKEVVGRMADPSTNPYLVEQMRNQFELDRSRYLALSSGNDAVDYQAIKNASGNPWSLGMGFPKIPLIGTQVAEFLDPITEQERAQWNATAPETRLELLNRYGFQQMATDFIGAIPALSATSGILAIARGGGIVGQSLAATYDWTLRGAGWMMSAGLAAAVTNWALEAAVPGYSEILGTEVDRARPISTSSLAGAVNALGYFSTGTYGAYNIARVAKKGLSVAAQANFDVRVAAAATHGYSVPSMSMPEMPLYNEGFGGSRMDGLLANAGLDPALLSLSKKRVVMSMLTHLARRPGVDAAEAALAGMPTGRIEIDALAGEEKLAAINDDLRANLGSSHYTAELMARVLVAARRDSKLFRTDQGRAIDQWYKSNARTIDEETARRFLSEYGPAFIKREAGAYTEAAMRRYVGKAMERLGGDMKPLDGIHGEDQWAKIMRSVHQYEFDYHNGDLAAALDTPSPGGSLPNERGKLSIISARHLFNDQVDGIVAVLRGDDEVAARHEVDRLIDDTIEGERWFSHDWRPPMGEARERSLVKPAEVADWIEDVQPSLLVRRRRTPLGSDTADLPLNALHNRLAEAGQWDIAFKPVDANGEFVSYVHTRAGRTFQTPWLDYPMGNADNIELGNRGFAMSKYDALTRAFRTRRVSDFQLGSLYRSLSGRFPGMTATQVADFHEGVLGLARRFSVQPQTLGTVSQGLAGIGEGYREAVDNLAARVFGKGPYRNAAGELIEVDWRKEIAKAYRQSLRLNFSAGLTSQMKSRFGSVGSTAAWMSDIGYVNLRFNLSPLFKAGEVVESRMYNAMAGAHPGGDPWAESLFYRNLGIGDDYGTFAEELTYDQTIAGMSTLTGKRQDPKLARQAQTYSFNSLRAPETMEQKTAAAALQARVEAHQAFVQAGGSVFASPRHALEAELANLVDDTTGFPLPGNEDRAAELLALLDSGMTDEEIRMAHQVGPELPNEKWTLDPAETIDQYGTGDPPNWIDLTTNPEDRGMWHTTTNVDAVHNTGLKSAFMLQDEAQAKGGAAPVGLGGSSHQISVTTEYMHAVAVQERLVLAALAARNQVEGSQIAEEFLILMDENGTDPGDAINKLGRLAGGTLSSQSVDSKLIDDLYMVTDEDELKRLLDEAVATPKVDYYRGTDPNTGESVRITTGDLWWDSHLFVTAKQEFAEDYGSHIEKLSLRPGAKVLREGTIDFKKMAGRARKNESMLQWASRVAQKAEAEGYDAVHFERQSDIGTIILNESAVNRNLERDMGWLGGEKKFRLVQVFDSALPRSVDEISGRGMSVGLIGSSSEAARIDPKQVGILQVGVKKGTRFNAGPDTFEMRVNPTDVWTMDHRILDQPLAEDKDGLLNQLRSTIRPDGETVIPGFEAYHDSIVRKLVAIDEAAKPPGELLPHVFRSATSDYPAFPEAEYVPTKLVAPLREVDREVRPRFTMPLAARSKLNAQYNEAIQHILGGRGVPTVHPITGEPWPLGKLMVEASVPMPQIEAAAAEQLRVERDQLTQGPAAGAKAYLDAFQAHVEERLQQGKPAFEEPIIVSYDPATNSAVVMDGNHRLALAARLGLEEVPVRISVQQHRTRPEFASAPPAPGYVSLAEEATLKAKVDGYIPASAKPSQIFSRRADQVDHIEDVFGTPEHLTEVITKQGDPAWQRRSPWDTSKDFARQAWEGLKNPVPGKQRQASMLQVEILRREFPALLHAAGLDGVAEVLGKELGIPERNWLPFLMRDRELATAFHNSGSPADYEALIEHAGGKAEQGKFDELYASEEWAALTGLQAIAGRTAADEAFRVHFFNPYRNAIERSLNHPLMGVYPLSWAYKAAREWARFLYDNRTFPELRLGMSPAVALASVVRAQNIAFAQSNPGTLEDYIGTKGPFGSTFLIFNLLLPGDWSTIPFPMSRTIRDALRGNLDAQVLADNLGALGLARDVRMGLESGSELHDFVWGPTEKPTPANGIQPPWRPHPNVTPYQPPTYDHTR